MAKDSSNLANWQRRFLLGAAAIAPVSPLLFLQGSITRWKVGVLPDAAGPREGRVGGDGSAERLLVLGESTVAGLGARDHEKALAGQFALFLSEALGRPLEWSVLGKNGVTARRVIDELLPHAPEGPFEHILLGIGGNDVMKLSSPRKWRHDMTELIGTLQAANPDAYVYISNCPMIKYAWAIPPPARQLLWQLSQMHDANIREFTADMPRVHYYPQPAEVELEGFFADGIHPSEKGYTDWASAMVDHFKKEAEW
jgi:lysophospholipase L1-like esterase